MDTVPFSLKNMSDVNVKIARSGINNILLSRWHGFILLAILGLCTLILKVLNAVLYDL